MAESAQIARMSHRHEAILNHMISHPTQPLGEVAGEFNVTPAWLSTIIHSHAFQDQLQRRKDELFDVAVLQELGSKLSGAAHATLDAYLEKVPTLTADQLISAQDKLIGRLGYGSNASGVNGKTVVNVNVQNNHVSKELVEEARNRIGKNQVGTTDSQTALQDKSTDKGTQIEGTLVRAESQPQPAGRARDNEVHSEPMVSISAVRDED